MTDFTNTSTARRLLAETRPRLDAERPFTKGKNGRWFTPEGLGAVLDNIEALCDAVQQLAERVDELEDFIEGERDGSGT